MTREDAVAECKRLAREHPDRETATWLAQERESGDWVVVKVPRMRPPLKRKDLRPGTEGVVRPDPSQDVPPEPRTYWGS
jgi:hypothetical protein